MGKSEVADSLSYQTFQTPPPACVTKGNQNPEVVNSLLSREHENMVNNYLKRKGEKMSGLKCETCGTELYTDPGVHELGIFLHAVAYADKTGKWKYRSKMPHWAMPPPGFEGPTKAPDWVEDESEEIVIGQGKVEGETALVEGLGTVSLSGAAEAHQIAYEQESKENSKAIEQSA
ncbi:60S ribosomal protein L32 [Ascosphaera pollenicola]|nr:60S ribosomal protein L32 [Ascosphaera pollenicola]